MNSCELTTYISALANIIAKDLTDDQISLLSSIFMQLGDTLDTIVSNNQLCKNNKSRNI